MNAHEDVDTGRTEGQYRQAYTGLWIAAGIALGAFTGGGYPLVGVGVYVVAIATAMGVWSRYPRPMFDERDREIHRTASGYTLTLVGYASAVVFPALTALYGLGYFTWEPWSAAVALSVGALYVTYGLVTVVVARRR